ncbi:MAG: hypothetical protein H6747_10320 [Deltaproteobacteria bacterium]|nr:hypothetical protein [Deltaproteobacteria bacterium]
MRPAAGLRWSRSAACAAISVALTALSLSVTASAESIPADAPARSDTAYDGPRERPLPGGSGLAWVFDGAGVDDLVYGWDELLTMPAPDSLGGPRSTLTPRELLAFAAGRVAFRIRYTVEQGLGPHYNESACSDCHAHPIQGGVGTLPQHVIHVRELPELPGDTVGMRRVTIAGHAPEQAAGRRGRRRTPPLFGLGLLDALPDAVLSENTDPEDRDHDGIRGWMAEKSRGGPMRPTRFGAKAHEWNLWRFVGAAMQDEMGMTNPASPARPVDADAVADPEVDARTMRRVDGFVRGLAPPPPAKRDAEAERGRALFAGIGCTGCHRETLGTVQGVYSDLLLHDLGETLDAGLDDRPANARTW